MSLSAQKITTCLTFSGQAEEAMTFYVSLFDQSEVLEIERYGANEPGPEGMVKRARFTLHGQQFLCIDSAVTHAWSFTPAISLFVACHPDEIDRLFDHRSAGGQVFMPLDRYPFSPRFAWVSDRYGVSWQLAVPPSSDGTVEGDPTVL